MSMYKDMERLELLAHTYAFTKEGTFYWEKFLILESIYNEINKQKYNRRW